MFGQPRHVNNPGVQATYKSEIFDKYDVDVVAHTWYKDGADYDVSTWTNMSHHGVPPKAPDIIREYWKPVELYIDPPTQFILPERVQSYIDERFGTSGHWNTKNYSNLMSQLFSINRVADYTFIRQVTHKIHYDWYILGRYDTTLHDLPDLYEYSNDKFFVPDNHRGFADMVQIFGPKHLQWAQNVFYDILFVYEGIAEPTPEAFKHNAFLKRYPRDDIFYHPMRAFAVR